MVPSSVLKSGDGDVLVVSRAKRDENIYTSSSCQDISTVRELDAVNVVRDALDGAIVPDIVIFKVEVVKLFLMTGGEC